MGNKKIKVYEYCITIKGTWTRFDIKILFYFLCIKLFTGAF